MQIINREKKTPQLTVVELRRRLTSMKCIQLPFEKEEEGEDLFEFLRGALGGVVLCNRDLVISERVRRSN